MSEGTFEQAQQLAGEIVLADDPGETIRRTRKRYEFTQQWLAPYLDVRRESLSRIESGHSNPSLSVVARFARILTLAKHVRAEAARREAGQGTPTPRSFRPEGSRLGLEPGTTDEVARQALETYSAKREALLEGLQSEPKERTR